MKNFVIGFVLGALAFGAVVAYADVTVLYDMLNRPVGVTGNPIYITVQ